MATNSKVTFGKFKDSLSKSAKISVASLVDNMEFQGTLREFCKKYGHQYDTNIVFQATRFNGQILFELA